MNKNQSRYIKQRYKQILKSGNWPTNYVSPRLSIKYPTFHQVNFDGYIIQYFSMNNFILLLSLLILPLNVLMIGTIIGISIASNLITFIIIIILVILLIECITWFFIYKHRCIWRDGQYFKLFNDYYLGTNQTKKLNICFDVFYFAGIFLPVLALALIPICIYKIKIAKILNSCFNNPPYMDNLFYQWNQRYPNQNTTKTQPWNWYEDL